MERGGEERSWVRACGLLVRVGGAGTARSGGRRTRRECSSAVSSSAELGADGSRAGG